MGWKFLGDSKTVAKSPSLGKQKKLVGTDQQEAIWEEMVCGKTHLQIVARAGTGKTTTLVEGLHRMTLRSKKPLKMALFAFNRHIAAEFKSRVPDGVTASTFHAFGMAAVTESLGRVQLNEDRTEILTEEMLGGEREWRAVPFETRMTLLKLVELCKHTLTGSYSDEFKDVTEDKLLAIVDRYGIEFDVESKYWNWLVETVPEVLLRSVANVESVDYNDMIWLPAMLELNLPQFDFVGVDEAQDLNASRQWLATHCGQRVAVVGDDRQAIYGWQGADPYSMLSMKTELEKDGEVVELKLTKTRRCPRRVVEEAKKIVPDFESLPDAPKGVVEFLVPLNRAREDFRAGDMVVCRTNAPMIREAYQMLANGQPAVISGKDIGASFVSFLSKTSGCRSRADMRNMPVAMLSERVNRFAERERSRLLRGRMLSASSALDMFNDKVSCITIFMQGHATGGDVVDFITGIFNDIGTAAKNVTTFSTVHKAKGLEADRVWILRPDLMPLPKARPGWEANQEENLKYVALTRAKQELRTVATPSRD